MPPVTSPAMDDPSTDTLEISIAEARRLLSSPADPSWLLIDCREQDEYDFCRLEGARLVPLSKFAEMAPQVLPPDSERPVMIYCHHGVRSMHATGYFRRLGHIRTWSIAGGIDSWSREIDPSVPRY